MTAKFVRIGNSQITTSALDSRRAAALSLAACAAPAPTVVPTDPPDETVWTHLDDLPIPGTVLLDLATNKNGFVIGGSAESITDSCPTQRDARIWSSRDGRSWSQRDVGSDVNASVAAVAGDLAVGLTGCGQAAPTAWRRAVTDWFGDLRLSGLESADEVVDLVGEQSGPFVASGHLAANKSAMGDLDGRIRWQGRSQMATSFRGPAVRRGTRHSHRSQRTAKSSSGSTRPATRTPGTRQTATAGARPICGRPMGCSRRTRPRTRTASWPRVADAADCRISASA